MSHITHLAAREILDCRGIPTLEVDVKTASGAMGRAAVPSGTSIGLHEAIELRDGEKRYSGKGVRKAALLVRTLEKRLKGQPVEQQGRIDAFLNRLDGTPNKARLGANTTLGISLALCRAAAAERKEPLYAYIHSIAGTKEKLRLPVPFSNVLDNGRHGGGMLRFQEFLLVPNKANHFSGAMQMTAECYQLLRKRLEARFGRTATLLGQEGGFSPPIEAPEEALHLLRSVIEEAGYAQHIQLGIDAAGSELYQARQYFIPQRYSSNGLVEYYVRLEKAFALCSIEDPFAQDDYPPWQLLMRKLGRRVQIIGDDLLATNLARIKLAKRKHLCNTLLLKPNQIGTLSDALAAARLAKKCGWRVMASHRAGETEDTFIADLAVALGCGQMKLGAPCRGERTAKWNQLVRIEEELGNKARYGTT